MQDTVIKKISSILYYVIKLQVLLINISKTHKYIYENLIKITKTKY